MSSPQKFFSTSPWGDWGEYLLDKIEKSGKKGSMGAEIILPLSTWYSGVEPGSICEKCHGEAKSHIVNVRICNGKISKIRGVRGCKDFIFGWFKASDMLPPAEGREAIAQHLMKRLFAAGL